MKINDDLQMLENRRSCSPLVLVKIADEDGLDGLVESRYTTYMPATYLSEKDRKKGLPRFQGHLYKGCMNIFRSTLTMYYLGNYLR